MALETLRGIEELGGFPVIVMDELRSKYPDKFNESGGMDYAWFEKEIRPHFHIYLRHDVGSLAFTFENGVASTGVSSMQ